jgi:hypothetical protein
MKKNIMYVSVMWVKVEKILRLIVFEKDQMVSSDPFP